MAKVLRRLPHTQLQHTHVAHKEIKTDAGDTGQAWLGHTRWQLNHTCKSKIKTRTAAQRAVDGRSGSTPPPSAHREAETARFKRIPAEADYKAKKESEKQKSKEKKAKINTKMCVS